jgi:hypothetical protein
MVLSILMIKIQFSFNYRRSYIIYYDFKSNYLMHFDASSIGKALMSSYEDHLPGGHEKVRQSLYIYADNKSLSSWLCITTL